MNLKTPKIDEILFWIAWAFGSGIVSQIIFPRLNALLLGTLIILLRVFIWSVQKTIEAHSKPKIQEQ